MYDKSLKQILKRTQRGHLLINLQRLLDTTLCAGNEILTISIEILFNTFLSF